MNYQELEEETTPPPGYGASPTEVHPNYGAGQQPTAPGTNPPPQGGALDPPPQGGAYPHEDGTSPPQGGADCQDPPPQGEAAYIYRPLRPPLPLPGSMQPRQPIPLGRSPYRRVIPPADDLPEDHNAPEPDPIPGYEEVGYYGPQASAPSLPPPASYNEVEAPSERPPEQYSSVASITEEQAREALMNHVAQDCCYGKSAAREMQIHGIAPSSAIHYKLETFTESRSTSREFLPYDGEPLDGPQNGRAPQAWAIPCQATALFDNETKLIEVPHTAAVKPCHACHTRGFEHCHRCSGTGFNRCTSCQGKGRTLKTDSHGHRYTEPCCSCHGTGRKSCSRCDGLGQITCTTCRGCRLLKCFICLTVKFSNNIGEHIVEKSDMPDELVKNVQGDIVFEQTLERVWPITAYPEPEVCSNSQRLINDHNTRFQSTHIVMQRHTLRAVPVTECNFKWKDKNGRFWVYGHEHAVHAPDYPQQICWGCNSLYPIYKVMTQCCMFLDQWFN